MSNFVFSLFKGRVICIWFLLLGIIKKNSGVRVVKRYLGESLVLLVSVEIRYVYILIRKRIFKRVRIFSVMICCFLGILY